MRSIFIKTCALVLLCLNTSALFCATELLVGVAGTIITELAITATSASVPLVQNAVNYLEEKAESIIHDKPIAAIANPLPFQPCILDFAEPLETSVKLGLSLCSAYVHKTLAPTYITYLTFEGLAAESRLKPQSLGNVSEFLNGATLEDKKTIYVAFQQIAELIVISEEVVGIFASTTTCEAFIANSIDNYLPQLLSTMGMKESSTSDEEASNAFIHEFSDALHKAYGRIENITNAARGIEEKIIEITKEVEDEAIKVTDVAEEKVAEVTAVTKVEAKKGFNFCLPWCCGGNSAILHHSEPSE